MNSANQRRLARKLMSHGHYEGMKARFRVGKEPVDLASEKDSIHNPHVHRDQSVHHCSIHCT